MISFLFDNAMTVAQLLNLTWAANMAAIENIRTWTLSTSAANRLIGEVVQSRLKAPTSVFTFKTLLRHNAKRALTHGK